MDNAENLKGKGIAFFNKGNMKSALESFQKAYDLFLTEGKETEAGEMLNNIGMVHRELGQAEESIASMEKAREVFRKIHDAGREGQTVANMAPIYITMKEHQRASVLYTEAESLLEAAGDMDKLGDVMMSHGLHEFEHGNRRAALDLYEKGLMKIKKPTAKQKQVRAILKMKTAVLK